MSVNLQNALFAFVAIAALALVVQTIGMLVLLVLAGKTAKNLRKELQQYRASLLPLIEQTRAVADELAPKVEKAAADLVDIAAKLREQTTDIHVAATDILGRTRSQVSRVDHMLTVTLDHVERASVFLSDSVAKPMRQISGLVASARAVVENMRDPNPRRARPPLGRPPYVEGERVSSARSATAKAPVQPQG